MCTEDEACDTDDVDAFDEVTSLLDGDFDEADYFRESVEPVLDQLGKLLQAKGLPFHIIIQTGMTGDTHHTVQGGTLGNGDGMRSQVSDRLLMCMGSRSKHPAIINACVESARQFEEGIEEIRARLRGDPPLEKSHNEKLVESLLKELGIEDGQLGDG